MRTRRHWARSPAWPGATVEETLKQVTERLERKLQEVENVDFLRSYTKAGVTRIFVNLKGSTPPDQVPDLWYDVRKKIGDIRHTLPQGVVGPYFNDEFGDTFGNIYALSGDGFDYATLKDYAERIELEALARGLDDGGDVIAQQIQFAIQQITDIDDHVEFLGAFAQSDRRFKSFRSGAGRP